MNVQFISGGTTRLAILPEADYLDLLNRAGLAADDLPPLPKPNSKGNLPALAYARASLARDIIQERKRLGLSQVDLAKRAGLRPETLNRIERALVTGSTTTIRKIDRALNAAATQPKSRRPASRAS